MKRIIFCTLAIMSLIAATSCEKGEGVTEGPKDAKGQWLMDMSDNLMLVDVRNTLEDGFVAAAMVPKDGYVPEEVSKDPYDPNYQWMGFLTENSSDRTTEGEWTIVNTKYVGNERITIKYSITSEDTMICKLSFIQKDGETENVTEEHIYICTKLDPPVELIMDSLKEDENE